MKRSLALLPLVTLAVGLSGCGRQGPLERPKDAAPLPVAAGASRPATADELMTPSTQARPQRNVDLLYHSDKRTDDPFDKPPGANNGR